MLNADIIKKNINYRHFWQDELNNNLTNTRDDWWQARSPFREDRHPSFSVCILSEKGGLWKDFGTSECGDVFNFLMKKYAWDFLTAINHLQERYNGTAKSIIKENRKRDIEFNALEWKKTYKYFSDNDEFVFLVARKHTEAGKIVRPFCPGADKKLYLGFSEKLKEKASRPIYCLPQIKRTYYPELGHGPLIAEGEKTADAINWLYGCTVCTTSSGGSAAAEKTDWTPIAHIAKRWNLPVILLPDKDAPGEKYIDQVANLILEKNPKTEFQRIQQTLDAPEGNDFADVIRELTANCSKNGRNAVQEPFRAFIRGDIFI
ncbi:MAG: CHC2 zinc finger domain-containing protein [bacterium]